MPLVTNCAGVTIYINSFDHPPPHLHVYQAEHEAMIRIDSGEIINGWLPRKTYRAIKEWIRRNKAELAARWSLAQQGQGFEPITEC